MDISQRVQRAWVRLQLPRKLAIRENLDEGVMKFKAVVFAVSFVVMGGMVTTSFAETQWERNHPRRDQVNDRLSNQNRRINNELKEGELNKQQANKLHREDRAIRQEERTMSKFNSGHITGAEQKSLNQQENAVSRQIGR
jgi:hypothetical protein